MNPLYIIIPVGLMMFGGFIIWARSYSQKNIPKPGTFKLHKMSKRERKRMMRK